MTGPPDPLAELLTDLRTVRSGGYPWRGEELFTLLREARYDRYTLCEAAESKEPERFLRWYKALWTELTRPCA